MQTLKNGYIELIKVNLEKLTRAISMTCYRVLPGAHLQLFSTPLGKILGKSKQASAFLGFRGIARDFE